jgi:hypothetical protein
VSATISKTLATLNIHLRHSRYATRQQTSRSKCRIVRQSTVELNKRKRALFNFNAKYTVKAWFPLNNSRMTWIRARKYSITCSLFGFFHLIHALQPRLNTTAGIPIRRNARYQGVAVLNKIQTRINVSTEHGEAYELSMQAHATADKLNWVSTVKSSTIETHVVTLIRRHTGGPQCRWKHMPHTLQI